MAHIRTRETYGTRRLQTELAENGIIVGRDRLARLRKELRLRCKQKRKFRATTNSNHNLPVAPNLLNQTFAPTAPNQVWVADLTYVATQEGWLYLAGIKDVYTCEIVGYAMGERMTKELTGKALNRPGFPGECFICELRLPDHRFRWKHNKLFLLLPEEYGPAFPAIVDCYTSPPT